MGVSVQHEEGSEMRRTQFVRLCPSGFKHASACVYVNACMCVCLCVQAAQLSQPRGTLCGPVIVVLMYFFNIQWNYRNRTTGRSERERKRGGEGGKRESPLSLGINSPDI